MKIVFFGSSDFSLPFLEKLINSRYDVSCVVTQPDRKKGRHLFFAETAVKQFAYKNNLKVLQPKKLKDKDFIAALKQHSADIFIVVAYGKILPNEVLSIPKIMPINVHASLLPRYRGAAPINWAIVNGEESTGVSIIKMNEFMDKGDIILRESLKIDDNDTAVSLSSKLSRLGADLLIECLELLKSRKVKYNKQQDKDASYAPELNKNDGLINWNKDAVSISNQVRGLSPWPGTFTHYKGKLLKIWQAQVLDIERKETESAMVVSVSKEGICVATGKGILQVKAMQLESGKRLSAEQFILGHRIKVGDKFD